MRVKVTSDANGVQKKLAAMAVRAQTMLPLYPKAKQYIRAANVSNFASNGLPVGGWDPLSPGYSSWKMSKFPGAPTMVRSGRLFNSLATLNGAENRSSATEFEFGTTVSYAKFHQYGTEKMPKRAIVFVPRGFAKWMSSNLGTWIVDGRA
jgi:phage gpG-like protein